MRPSFAHFRTVRCLTRRCSAASFAVSHTVSTVETPFLVLPNTRDFVEDVEFRFTAQRPGAKSLLFLTVRGIEMTPNSLISLQNLKLRYIFVHVNKRIAALFLVVMVRFDPPPILFIRQDLHPLGEGCAFRPLRVSSTARARAPQARLLPGSSHSLRDGEASERASDAFTALSYMEHQQTQPCAV